MKDQETIEWLKSWNSSVRMLSDIVKSKLNINDLFDVLACVTK
jgi:hypothetical protein